MISRRQAIASGAVVVLLGIIFARSTGSLAFWNYAPRKTPDPQTQDTSYKALLKKPDEGPALTKRSVRDMGPKPTLEETQDLLRTTIISKIVVEDATLEETVAELNRLSRSHGVPERELIFVIGHRLSARLRSSPFRVRELRITNAPLNVLPKYLCDSTKLRARTSPGRVTFGHYEDFDAEPALVVQEETEPGDDPFAEPGQEVRKEKMPVDPDNPFSE